MNPYATDLFDRAKQWLSLFLIAALAVPATAVAQNPPAAPSPATVQSLRIVPLAGDGEMNDLKSKVMAPLVIQVLDQNSRPVDNVAVTFRFPTSGPSAVFPDQRTSQTIQTNADGQAALIGWTANNMTGRFEIQVTASRGNEFGTAAIHMTNVSSIAELPSRGEHKSWWSHRRNKIIVIAGAAAVAAAVIFATRGSGTTTLTAVPGFPTIGGSQ